MKKLILLFACMLVCFMVSAQTSTVPKYNVPEEYSLVLPEDYTTYQPQIEETIDWYLWRTMALDADKRQKAVDFFMKWLTGTPTVTVDIDFLIVNFTENNPQLLVPFCMGWVKYSLENSTPDRNKECAAGIEASIAYYNKNRAYMNKSDNIEKYEKMMKKNKLESYINKNFAPKK